MPAGTEARQPIDLVFHNIHEHGVGIIDRWITEVERRTGGRVRFTKTAGEDPALIRAADVVRDVPAAAAPCTVVTHGMSAPTAAVRISYPSMRGPELP